MSSMTLKEFMTRGNGGMEKRGGQPTKMVGINPNWNPGGSNWLAKRTDVTPMTDSLFLNSLGAILNGNSDSAKVFYDEYLRDKPGVQKQIMRDAEGFTEWLVPLIVNGKGEDALSKLSGAELLGLDKITSQFGFLGNLVKSNPELVKAFAHKYILQYLMKQMGMDPSKVYEYAPGLASYDMNQHIPGMALAFGLPFGIGAITGHPGWGALLGLLGAGGYGYYQYNKMNGNFATPPDLIKEDKPAAEAPATEEEPAPAEEAAPAEQVAKPEPLELETDNMPEEDGGVTDDVGETDDDLALPIPGEGSEVSTNVETPPTLEEPVPTEKPVDIGTEVPKPVAKSINIPASDGPVEVITPKTPSKEPETVVVPKPTAPPESAQARPPMTFESSPFIGPIIDDTQPDWRGEFGLSPIKLDNISPETYDPWTGGVLPPDDTGPGSAHDRGIDLWLARKSQIHRDKADIKPEAVPKKTQTPEKTKPVTTPELSPAQKTTVEAAARGITAQKAEPAQTDFNKRVYGQPVAPQSIITPKPVNPVPQIGAAKSNVLPFTPKPFIPDPVGY